MNTTRATRMLLLAALLAAAPAGRAEEVKLNTRQSFPWAGVSLQLPTGYQTAGVDQPDEIFLARRIEGAQATRSISLTVSAVQPGMKAKQYTDDHLEGLGSELATRNVEILSMREFVCGGRDAVLSRVRYTYRGIATEAAHVVYVRPLQASDDQADHSVAYMLTMEVQADQADALEPTILAVCGSLKYEPIRHPIDLPRVFDGPFLKNFKHGVVIRQPDGWFGSQDQLGLVLGQIDLRRGLISPSVHVVSLPAPKNATAEQCGRQVLAHERKLGDTVEVLSQGPVRLGDIDGYEFVVRRMVAPASQPATDQATRPNTPARPILELHRMAIVPAEGDQPARYHALLLTCRVATLDQARQLMDELAEHVSFFEPVREIPTPPAAPLAEPARPGRVVEDPRTNPASKELLK